LQTVQKENNAAIRREKFAAGGEYLPNLKI
jgi:hypothetical protein